MQLMRRISLLFLYRRNFQVKIVGILISGKKYLLKFSLAVSAILSTFTFPTTSYNHTLKYSSFPALWDAQHAHINAYRFFKLYKLWPLEWSSRYQGRASILLAEFSGIPCIQFKETGGLPKYYGSSIYFYFGSLSNSWYLCGLFSFSFNKTCGLSNQVIVWYFSIPKWGLFRNFFH